MEEAAVGLLLENLKQLLLNHTNLIHGAKNQVGKLENDLRRFKAFLKDSTKQQRKDEGFADLSRRIREAVHEAEDIVDNFVTQATERKSKSFIRRSFLSPLDHQFFTREVEDVSSKFLDIQSNMDFSNLIIEVDGPAENEAPLVRHGKVVGFEDEAEKLISCLNQETDQLDVISIIGMPGLGKTTLARKIFQDSGIQREFPTRIWVYISQQFTKKNVFLTILGELRELTDNDLYHKNDQQLAIMVENLLKTKKFLIVMDAVWTIDDWNNLQIALPMSNKMGKVLITCREGKVAAHANRDRIPHKLRFLTEKESWLLFNLEVFGKSECPHEFEVLAKPIVERCSMLPLCIVVIGGILAERVSAGGDVGAMRNAMRNVSKSVSTYLTTEDPARHIEKVIALSYNKLPYHLRPCFLYFAMFPEDFEISAWKLTRMWISEGFIQQSGISMEETAENYLDDLISRNLVRVDKRSRDGKVKICSIHDTLWDYCKIVAESERENFLHEPKKLNEGTYNPVVAIEKRRRLCIHSNVLKFVSLKPHGPRVRSFVCCSMEDIIMPEESISVIPSAFKLLRILEAKPIKLTQIPRDMSRLIHLRYIVISINFKIIPSAFSKLWNIQTLIVETTSPTLEIKANVWKMLYLRHLKMNASTTLPKTRKNSKEGEDLQIQTLGKISPESCTEEVFRRVSNIKTLGIRGQLATFMDTTDGSFHNLGKLYNLEKLKLVNDVSQVCGLPRPYQFPPQLRSLTLSGTRLDWEHMAFLGQLENLEILKLKDEAFMGECWEVVTGGFKKLEVLYIERTNLKSWKASMDHFPVLRCLDLEKCENLEEVPIELANLQSFQNLNMYHGTPAAVASAKKIWAEKLNIKESGTEDFKEFKLLIVPPGEQLSTS